MEEERAKLVSVDGGSDEKKEEKKRKDILPGSPWHAAWEQPKAA